MREHTIHPATPHLPNKELTETEFQGIPRKITWNELLDRVIITDQTDLLSFAEPCYLSSDLLDRCCDQIVMSITANFNCFVEIRSLFRIHPDFPLLVLSGSFQGGFVFLLSSRQGIDLDRTTPTMRRKWSLRTTLGFPPLGLSQIRNLPPPDVISVSDRGSPSINFSNKQGIWISMQEAGVMWLFPFPAWERPHQLDQEMTLLVLVDCCFPTFGCTGNELPQSGQLPTEFLTPFQSQTHPSQSWDWE